MRREILVVVVIIFSIMGSIPMVAWGQSINETTTRTKLKMVVPVRKLREFVAIDPDPISGENIYSGFAIEVFREVVKALPSPFEYEFVPFNNTMNGSFNAMLSAVFSKEYDGAVGDISILSQRTEWVDFTMPYLESAITMLVPIKQQPAAQNVAGVSVTKITEAIVIVTFVISTIVALIYICDEAWRRKADTGKDARWRSGMHKGLLKLSIFIICIVLFASYIVSESSLLASQVQSGTVKSLTQLLRNVRTMGSKVGYREASFIFNLLILKGFPKEKLVSLSTNEEMVDQLSKGTAKGGVDAIVANAPYLKLLQSKHCNDFTIVPTNLHTTGFGFAFRIGSDVVGDVSKAILKIVDNGVLGKIQDSTIGSLETCQDEPGNQDVGNLYLPRDHQWILIVGGFLASLFIVVSLIFFVCHSFGKPRGETPVIPSITPSANGTSSAN